MNIQARKVSLKRIRIGESCRIHELATKLDALLDAESIQKIVEFGMKSACSEEQLAQTVKELEERKKQLESDFQKIARQLNEQESKYVGLRNEISRVFTDNRIQVFHLCARSPSSRHERLLRDELIRKYIAYSKLM
jgi:hypothetical protein